MAIDKGSEVTTKLLTLLNVSATKAGKRKWSAEVTRASEKLNKRRAVGSTEPATESEGVKGDMQEGRKDGEDIGMKESPDDAEDEELVGGDGNDEGELGRNL